MQALGYELHGIENPPVASIFNSYSYQAPNNHLTLKPGSPAIGMGLNLGSAYAYDITGEARPAGGFWDACLLQVYPARLHVHTQPHIRFRQYVCPQRFIHYHRIIVHLRMDVRI